MIYKTLKKVSDVCQLLDKRKFTETTTTNGITFTNNGDGSYTANGTLSSYLSYLLVTQVSNLIVGHKYYSPHASHVSGVYVETKILTNNANVIYIEDEILEWGENETVLYITLVTDVGQNSRVENVILKPQLFDLTEMYGAGNEPTTVEQFRQDFPDEMYDYKPYCFVKSYKNCLKVCDVCQLVDKRNFPATQTINGVTFTNNGDGTITANGTAIKNIYFTILSAYLELSTHKKYLLTGCPSGGSSYTYFLYVDRGGALFDLDSGNGSIGTPTKSSAVITIFVRQGLTFNNLVFKPQLFDLTEMYGSGNEPTTVEQFRADFPNELYDYKPYSIVPSYKKSLKVTDSILL